MSDESFDAERLADRCRDRGPSVPVSVLREKIAMFRTVQNMLEKRPDREAAQRVEDCADELMDLCDAAEGCP